MSKTPLLFTLLYIFCLGMVNAASLKEINGTIQPVVRYYQDKKLVQELLFKLSDGERITDTNGAEWMLSVTTRQVKERPDAQDYSLTWTLVKGNADAVAVGVEFSFAEWTSREFVFVPAIVYDGNRFDMIKIDYPPYWYDKKDWRLDMPTTTSIQQSLGKTGTGELEITTGNASTPLMAFHSPEKQRGWIVLTTQGSRYGNHGFIIEEDKQKAEGRFTITAPSVRAKRAAGTGEPSEDIAPDWKTGDTLTLQFRVYSFKSPAVKDLLKRFSEVRKDLNSAERKEVLPFSEAWKLYDRLFQQELWDESINMFCFDKPGSTKNWNGIWQLGWCGGGLNTMAMLLQGNGETRRRAIKNIETIFAKTQAPSGLFYAIGNGNEFAGFGFSKPFQYNETFVRSQGDWLYMAQRQFEVMESKGEKVPDSWLSGLQKQADAFARLWDKYGQFGQFVDVETGDICVGGSTSGAIVCGGLALASQTFGKNCHCGLDPQSPAKAKRYLKIAEAAAEKYYRDFVLKGYTTGGPGEILSAPDSESAFGLFESFTTLFEVTGNKKWLTYASDLLPICAGWTVSYDYIFPENSIMNKLDARSCGSVWASVANQHSAPGICTWSGDCLLRYFRATGDRRAIELLTDIAHGLPQYISRTDRPIGGLPSGGMCERVNLSDWEGKKNVGGNIFGRAVWCETAGMLTVTQLPGLYIQPNKGFYTVLDNIQVDLLETNRQGMCLRLSNPTSFPADVKVFSESAKQAKKTLFRMNEGDVQVIHLAVNETKEVWFGK
jgi:hypothetical protein